MVALIETYPDALLQSDQLNWLVLGTLTKFRCTLHQVWHTAGKLCIQAFICATQKSLQPLHYMSYKMYALVENFIECRLDWTKYEGDMRDAELAGIILHYTYEALLQANHRLDSESNLPLSGDVVRPWLPDDNNYSTVKTTLLHKLAYCSKFCDQDDIMSAVGLYESRHSADFCQADNNGNLPLHLVCCAPPPSIMVGEYEKGFREKTYFHLVETFLTPCMEAASKTNHLGKTPLDILMETYLALHELNIDSWHGMQLLVKANPKEANKLFTKEKMYLFMLAAIGQEANLSIIFSMLLSFVSYQNLDDLGSIITVQKNQKAKGFKEMNDLVI